MPVLFASLSSRGRASESQNPAVLLTEFTTILEGMPGRKRKKPTQEVAPIKDETLHVKLQRLEQLYLILHTLSSPWYARDNKIYFEHFQAQISSLLKSEVSLDDLKSLVYITDHAFVDVKLSERREHEDKNSESEVDVYAMPQHALSAQNDDFKTCGMTEVVFIDRSRSRLTGPALKKRMMAVRRSLFDFQKKHRDLLDKEELPKCSFMAADGVNGGLRDTNTTVTNDLTSIDELVAKMTEQEWFQGNIVSRRVIAAQPAEMISFRAALSEDEEVHEMMDVKEKSIMQQFGVYLAVAQALQAKGINQLYGHQVKAIQHIRAGRHIILSTSTASGKSMVYTIPILEDILQLARQRRAHLTSVRRRALLVFPTKALAQDQLRSLRAFIDTIRDDELSGDQISVDTLDGDTPYVDRNRIIATSDIILTNPDMLHSSILPKPGQFSVLFSALKYVVLDETHVYHGIFGSHVALVIRRLRRLCLIHSSQDMLQFIGCSATMSDGAAFFSELTGVDAVIIDKDTSSRGRKLIAMWAPEPDTAPETRKKSPTKMTSSPVKGKMMLSQRESRLMNVLEGRNDDAEEHKEDDSSFKVGNVSMAAKIIVMLVQHNINCLCFCGSRQLSEKLTFIARQQLDYKTTGKKRNRSTNKPSKIMCYRGGYLPKERRDIERRFFNGDIRAMVCTNALELGVDVGALKVVLHLGFPTSAASFWQQAGRAGRRSSSEDSLSFILAFDSPMDHYFLSQPAAFFDRPIETNQIFPHNVTMLQAHLICACFEAPLDPDDRCFQFDGISTHGMLQTLVSKGIMKVNSMTSCYELCGFVWASSMDLFNSIGGTVRHTKQSQEAYFNWIFPSGYKTTSSSSSSAAPLLIAYEPGGIASEDNQMEAERDMSSIASCPAELLDIRNSKKEERHNKFRVFDIDLLAYLDDIGEERQVLVFFYPGSLYYKQGVAYTVTNLDFSLRVAYVKRVPDNLLPITYYTTPMKNQRIDVSRSIVQQNLSVDENTDKTHVIVACGRVTLRLEVTGYTKKSKRTRVLLDTVDIILPSLQFEANAMWLDFSVLPHHLVHEMYTRDDLLAGMHALGHCFIELMPLMAPRLDGAHELRANCVSNYEMKSQVGATGMYRLIIYEINKEGLGLSKIAYENVMQVLTSCLKRLQDCPCSSGCPGCCHSKYCQYYNALVSKRMAIFLLTRCFPVHAKLSSSSSSSAKTL